MSESRKSPPPNESEVERLRRENSYLRQLAEHTAARMLALDAKTLSIRYELEQKRRGFRLMTELAVSLGQDTDFENLFLSTSRRINYTLNMQRTTVLMPTEDENVFQPGVLQGYSSEERSRIAPLRLRLPPELLDPLCPILVTGQDPNSRLAPFREALELPYLISAPVYLQHSIAAVLVTGRIIEKMPYMPRLGANDVETVQTVSAYLAAMLAGHRLRQAELLAKHDPLTQLPNLRGTTEHLRHLLALARRGGNLPTVMFIDLDGFKQVNDTFGHSAGDIVLRIIGERLRDCLRESDIVGRIGGDEFLVMLSHIADPRDAGIVARKILEALAMPIDVCGATAKIGASIGIAVFPEHGCDETGLIRAADAAMYSVKSSGKNSYAFAERKKDVLTG